MLKHIIITKGSQRDVDDSPERVKKVITFYPLESLEEVLEICFGVVAGKGLRRPKLRKPNDQGTKAQ